MGAQVGSTPMKSHAVVMHVVVLQEVVGVEQLGCVVNQVLHPEDVVADVRCAASHVPPL